MDTIAAYANPGAAQQVVGAGYYDLSGQSRADVYNGYLFAPISMSAATGSPFLDALTAPFSDFGDFISKVVSGAFPGLKFVEYALLAIAVIVAIRFAEGK